ncbi:MAG: alpha/beta hydrolase, partial [Gemmatimonadetes bacterium]
RAYNRRAFTRSLRAVFGRARPPDEGTIEALWYLLRFGGGLRVVHRTIRYLHERRRLRDRWVEALVRCEVPLRFVVGMEDPVSGAAMAERYEALIPTPDIVRLGGIGHFPQLEAPDAVLAAFEAWVEGGAAG